MPGFKRPRKSALFAIAKSLGDFGDRFFAFAHIQLANFFARALCNFPERNAFLARRRRKVRSDTPSISAARFSEGGPSSIMRWMQAATCARTGCGAAQGFELPVQPGANVIEQPLVRLRQWHVGKAGIHAERICFRFILNLAANKSVTLVSMLRPLVGGMRRIMIFYCAARSASARSRHNRQKRPLRAGRVLSGSSI